MTKLRSTKYPIGHILNPATPYTTASQTDIKATFERIKAEQQKQKDAKVYRMRQK